MGVCSGLIHHERDKMMLIMLRLSQHRHAPAVHIAPVIQFFLLLGMLFEPGKIVSATGDDECVGERGGQVANAGQIIRNG